MWNIIFILLIAAHFAIRLPFIITALKANNAPHWQARSLLLIVLGVVLNGALIYRLATDGLFQTVLMVPALIGAGAGVISLVILFLAHKELGLFLFTEKYLMPEHELVISGIYGKIRHPMYLAIILFLLSLSLISLNSLLMIFAAVVSLHLLLIKTTLEDNDLSLKFGGKYNHYRYATGRLFPKPDRNDI